LEADAMVIPEFLRENRVPFETLLHQPAPSATMLARSVHTPGRRVAKSVLVKAGERYVLAVLPATHKIDLGRLAGVLGVSQVVLATEDEVEQVFQDCERGALPPFGSVYGLTTVVDQSLAGPWEIVFEGNLRHEGFRMRYRDFEAVEVPIRASFASVVTPRRATLPR
jgi:Ala-tRNA(Pro) deacylase